MAFSSAKKHKENHKNYTYYTEVASTSPPSLIRISVTALQVTRGTALRRYVFSIQSCNSFTLREKKRLLVLH